MAEMPHASENHGDAGLVGGTDHLLVTQRAARLDHRRGAGFNGFQEAVGEGEKGIGRDDGPLSHGFGRTGRIGGID